MGVLDGKPVSAAYTNPIFLNKNQADNMPFALTLNAVSSATIADIQATANKLYNATGASELATGTVYNATAGTITNGQSHQTALTILANKFDAATGHHHTGAAGDGPILPASGLGSFPLLGYLVQGSNIVGATGTSWDVTSLMTGYTPTSSPTTPGVAVDSGHNKIRLLSAATGNAYHDLPDATGNLVYGRLSSATGSWTLSFFSEISNVETPYSFSSPQSLFWWFQQLAYPNVATPPVYIPVMDMFSTSVPSFGTFGSTPNSAGASLSGSQITLQPADATHPGGVNFSGLQTFGGNKAFNQVIPLTTSTASAAGTTTLSVTSTQIQILTGTSTQTFKLPDATTLALGQTYMFINSSTGALTIQDNASGAVFTVSAGNVCVVEVTNIGSAAGTWISRLFIPSNLTASQAIVTDANKNPASLAYSTTGSTVSSLAERDANANLSANNVLEGYTTTATAAATTTLTVASTFLQFFTGSTTQTVQLPVTSTLVLGQQFEIVNLSTGTVTVTSSGGNTVATLTANTSVVVTCILTSGTTAASWTSVAGGGGGASPLTTKGDVYTFSTVNDRQPVPGDYGRMVPDSNQSTGWRSAPYTSIQQGRPGKNYIQYSDFENGATTGWSLGTVTLTSNLPTGVPTFGSGASGNLSISATTSSPIAGTTCLSYASSAATTAGNFVASSALTIDIEDQAKVLGFRFAYKAQTNPSNGNFSGTTSNSFGVAIYDVTNSAWIIPAGVFNLVQNSGVGICTGTWQTPANMTQFRIVVYNANASAGAITMYFDDFYCGPQTMAFGPAMTSTGTTLSTISPSAGFGTVTNNLSYSRRNGDRLEIWGSFQQGTVAASTAYLAFSAVNVDYTKISTDAREPVGYLYRLNGSSSTFASTNYGAFPLFLDGTITNQVFVANASSSNAFAKVNGNTIATNSGEGMGYFFSVPIAGWDTNTVMSADTDTRIVAATYYISAGTQAPGANTQFNFDTKITDTHGAVTTGAGAWKFTAPVTGIYNVSASMLQNSSTAGALVIYKNGTNYSYINVFSSAFSPNIASGDMNVPLNAGDFVDLRPSTNVTVTGGTNPFPSMVTIYRLSGPAVVAASEKVTMTAYSDVATSIPNTTWTIVPAVTGKLIDSHNAWSTDTFTTPRSGPYTIAATVRFPFSASATAQMAVYKNGSYLTNFATGGINTSGITGITGSVTIPLNAGDTVSVYLNHNNGGAVSLSTGTVNGNQMHSFVVSIASQ